MRAGIIIVTAAVLLASFHAQAFAPLITDDGIPLRWDLAAFGGSVPYYINQSGTGQVLCGDDEFMTFQQSFGKWNSIPTSRAQAGYQGTTTNADYDRDYEFVLLFVSGDPDISDPTLAVTFYSYRISDGKMLEADIAFNDDMKWTTDPGLCGGSDVYDLRSVATHEIGHFFGLDHSALGRYAGEWKPQYMATMFPYYFGDEEITLEQDDIAGMTYLYPEAGPSGLGRIKGRVLDRENDGLFSIHVVALSADGKVPVVSGISDKYGGYELYGLPPGGYYLIAESPYISGGFYTSYLSSSSYYLGADRLSSSWLYTRVEVPDQGRLRQGSSIYDDARKVRVAADEVKRDVDFLDLGDVEGKLIELKFDFESSGSTRCGQIGGGGSEFSFGYLILFFVAALLGLRLVRPARRR